MFSVRTLAVIMMAALWITCFASAKAAVITITFSEGDTGVSVSLTNITGCGVPPCIIATTTGAESATVDLLVAPNAFPLPAGGMAQAFQVESDGKTISDILTLRVIAAENRVNIVFQSDDETNSFGQIPAGFVFSNIEGVGSPVDLSFFTGPANDSNQQRPYSLPVGPPDEYHIKSISDGDVPEPSTGILSGLGFAALAWLASTRARLKS